jgi:type VI protein secretion system component VasK
MAVALVAAPVIYPWYLLYLTPFLFGLATVPLTAWTITVISTYAVWQLATHGARWVVPTVLVRWEYGIPIAVALFLVWRTFRRVNPAEPRRALRKPERTQQNPVEPSSTL